MNSFREKYGDACEKYDYFKKKAELIDTFPERIIDIIRDAGKPIGSGYIEFILTLQEFNKLTNEDKLDFYNNVDHFDVLDAIHELFNSNRLLECIEGRKLCLPEWNIEGAYNPTHTGW